MTTSTVALPAEDYGEAGPGSVALAGVVEEGFAISLPDGALLRQPVTRRIDPGGDTPTVWFHQRDAEGVRAAIATELQEMYHFDLTSPDVSLLVVRVVRGSDGVWHTATLDQASGGYRPIDEDTGQPAELGCLSRAELTVDTARRVMRQHKSCAGPVPCRVRGRARALLARQGQMVLVSGRRAATVWESLCYPERQATPGDIGGRKLVHLAWAKR